jgi:thioredoxin-related protein
MYHMLHQLLGKIGLNSAATLLVATLAWPGVATATELVMFEKAGCPFCQRWDRDVGASYAKTDTAKTLPLRRVNIAAAATSGVRLASPVRYTPTFIVVDDGREVGRITGYTSDEAFWGLLNTLAAKLKPARAAGQT